MRAIIVFSALFFAVIANPKRNDDCHDRSSSSCQTSMKYPVFARVVHYTLPTTCIKNIATTPAENASGIQELIIETSPGVYHIKNLTGPVPHYEVTEKDLKFYFASKVNESHIRVDLRDPISINETSFSPNKDTWILVHGWKTNSFENMEEIVGNSVLEKTEANVFFVDWSSISEKSYLVAFEAVPEIGRIVGTLFGIMVNNHGLQLNKVYLVGHSLGAHIAGRIGYHLQGNVSLIVGLDPAGPLFSYEIPDRLDPANAQFVQVIHTCTYFVGFRNPLGHADYYPNGGELQPACPHNTSIESLIESIECSHSISYDYFAESIISGNFTAKSCTSKDDFEDGKCNNNTASEMGGYSPDRKASGTYYLNTNKKPPYAKG